jgi:hypothetical protein
MAHFGAEERPYSANLEDSYTRAVGRRYLLGSIHNTTILAVDPNALVGIVCDKTRHDLPVKLNSRRRVDRRARADCEA